MSLFLPKLHLSIRSWARWLSPLHSVAVAVTQLAINVSWAYYFLPAKEDECQQHSLLSRLGAGQLWGWVGGPEAPEFPERSGSPVAAHSLKKQALIKTTKCFYFFHFLLPNIQFIEFSKIFGKTQAEIYSK